MPRDMPELARDRGRRSLAGRIPRRWGGVLTLGLLLAVSVGAAAAEVHVAPGGSDANPGTRERPVASLEAARDLVRQRRSAPDRRPGGITVWLAGGDYFRTHALELSAADSGGPEEPVVWRAVPGEVPRWLGGIRVTGFEPVTDPGVLERLVPEARGKVLRCVLDLERRGLAGGGLVSRGFGRATVPAHYELFFAGRPMTLARWPNEGAFEKIAGFPEGGAKGDDHGGRLGELAEGFHYPGDRPRRWRTTEDLWVHGYWAWDWANSYERVASLDTDRRWIKTAPPHGLYGFRQGQRFYFLNVFEELDQPGEWYLDRQTGTLYFWPPGPAAAAEALLSVSGEPLIRLRDASWIHFRGLVLEATRASAVEIRGGTSARIEACVIRNVGNHGVWIEGGNGHGVAGCDVQDTGDGGVGLNGGDRRTLIAGSHWVENSHFRRQGRWSKCYVPAILMQGVGLRASRNLIEDHPHCAILFGGNDHLLEFNEIRRVALETGDVGAIYAGRDFTFRGNRIRHNYIHHTGGVGMGSMGVYMDDCVSGTEIYGNVFYRVQRAAFLGGGRDHRVANNVFVDCNHAVELDGRGLDPSPVWRGMVNDTMRQRLADVPSALYRERYPELRGLDRYYGPPEGPALAGDAFRGVPPEGNEVARNLCAGKWLNVSWHATKDMLKLEGNVVTENAGFVAPIRDDARAVDFALRADSPVWANGFRALPLSEIGLRDDEVRRSRPGGGLR